MIAGGVSQAIRHRGTVPAGSLSASLAQGFRVPRLWQHHQLPARGLYQCHRCHHQTALTAGTIFHATHLPLTTWFLAIYLLTQRKSGISALQLSRELGVTYNTAWKLNHKLLQVMHERNQGERLSGRIEIDDAYLGGERPGKRGRGATTSRPCCHDF